MIAPLYRAIAIAAQAARVRREARQKGGAEGLARFDEGADFCGQGSLVGLKNGASARGWDRPAMTKTPPPDRRMNPARKKATGTVYLLEFDDGAGRWNVTRNGVPTGAFARDKSTAVGQAYHAASSEKAETGLNVTVWSVDGGKRKREWPADA